MNNPAPPKSTTIHAKKDDRLGTVQGHRDGFGFVIPDDGLLDIFLSEREMARVMHGDRVLVKVLGTDRRGRPEGQIAEVIERANRHVIGRLLNENGVLIVAPEDKRISHDILIPPKGHLNAKLGQVVSVEIIDYPDSYRQAVGRVVEVLGEIDDPGMEIEIAVRKYGVPHEFTAATLKEAAALPDEVREEDLEERVDLRDIPLVTIDGEDARDFDDAVYCEPMTFEGGKAWRLIVAIADVSHYVKPGHPLDSDAIRRGTSVYFPRRVIPMLPEKISNGLCSLKPGVDRLCMVCDAVVDAKGIVQAYQFYPAIMHSVQRFTYNIVWEILSNTNGPESVKYAQQKPHLQNLYRLFQTLKVSREKRGAIDFDTTETQIISNEFGKIERIEPRVRNDAHRLIEECMLVANVCAANFIGDKNHLGLFRVHGEPTIEKVNALRDVLRSAGLSLEGGTKPRPMDYAKLITSIKSRPDAGMLQTVILRSMQQAVYQPENLGHFGLSYPAYTHFTSPIRRYPDLLVHRTIKAILAKKNYKPTIPEDVPLNLAMPKNGPGRVNAALVKKNIADNTSRKNASPEPAQKTARNRRKSASDGADIAAWAQLGVHCSANERRADEASRDVETWLKCFFMRDRLGQEFAGTITGATTFGLFVQLETLYVEGLIHISELGGDYYNYDEVRQELRGERTGIRYRLGDRVHVLVSRVDLDARKIEFSLVKNTQDRGRFSPPVTMDDSGRPNKKAAPKHSRPPEKAPKVGGMKVGSPKKATSRAGNKPKAASNAKRKSVEKASPSSGAVRAKARSRK
ncbi:MAG: ribonuclease R [Betaproteobacteria bacterium]